LAAPILVDLDGDPDLEILFHSSLGNLHAFDGDGAVLYTATTSVKPQATPLAGDFDGDGTLDLVSTSYAGALQGDGTMAYATLGVPWREDVRNRVVFAGNRARSGRRPDAPVFAPLPAPARRSREAAARFAPRGELALFSGENVWRFDVDNPDLDRLVLLTSIEYPDGSVRRLARHVRGAKERLALAFDVHDPGAYQATFQLLDGDARARIASTEASFRFEGFNTDRAYLTEAVFAATETTAQRWHTTNPRAADDVSLALARLKGALAALDGVHDADRQALLPTLRQDAERLRDLAAAGAALAPTGSFCVWECCPWAYFDGRQSLPSPERQTARLSASLLVGEYESLALNVTNLSGRTIEIRVASGRPENGDSPGSGTRLGQSPFSGPHVALRRAVTVPTTRRKEVADALPALDQGNLLTLPPFESQQLWITLDAVGVAPGSYKIPLSLTSLEPEPTVVTIPVETTVHDLALPRPRPLRFCVWSYIDKDEDHLLRDLVEHGTTVFFGSNPTATCNADGELVGDVDFAAHDESVARLSPHGIVMFIGAQGGVKGAPFLSPAWRKAYIAYLRAWVEHMTALGLDYADWALYPYDEPSTPYTETTLNLVEVAKATREADPNVLIYTDPTSGATMETIDMLTGLIDIWCPSSELIERLGDEMIPVIKEVGKQVWFYDAAGRAKTLSTLGIYRWRFWYAWNLGFTGAGWWTYAYGDEQWQGWNSFGDFYCTVYPNAGGVVTSKRWEVAREGIEDYELLYLLRDTIERAAQRGVAEEQLARARAVLDAVPKEMEATLHGAGRRLPLTPDSVPLYEEITASLQDARRQIIETCLLLKASGQ